MTKRRKRILIIASPIAVIFILLYIVPFFNPWSRLHCWKDYIDINSGRSKYEKYMFYLKVVDRTEETEMSRSYRKLIGEPLAPEWHITTTFSPWYGNSPQYQYHGALAALYLLELAYTKANFTDEAKKETILNFLKLLKESKSYRSAHRYSINTLYVAEEKSKQLGYQITVADLPKIPEEK